MSPWILATFFSLAVPQQEPVAVPPPRAVRERLEAEQRRMELLVEATQGEELQEEEGFEQLCKDLETCCEKLQETCEENQDCCEKFEAWCSEQTNPNAFWVLPYLQRPAPTAMTVIWWTYERGELNFIDYGPGMGEDPNNGVMPQRVSATTTYVQGIGKWRQEVSLAYLHPETRYVYRVTSVLGDGTSLISPVYHFSTTKKRSSDLKFSFLGDGRTDDQSVIYRHREVAEMAADSDLIFEAGDIVYDGSVDHWGRFLRQILTRSDPENPGSTVGSNVPYHLMMGNHELAFFPEGINESQSAGVWIAFEDPGASIRRFQAVAANPPSGSSSPHWNELYYVLRYGAVTFIVLETNNTGEVIYDNHNPLLAGMTPSWQPGSEQYRWLERELRWAQKRSVFTFVLFHPSPFSSGTHGAPPREGLSTQRGFELRKLHPLFMEYGVDGVISSHDHFAARSVVGAACGETSDGLQLFETTTDASNPSFINYFVVGNSGHSSRHRAGSWESWMTSCSAGGGASNLTYEAWFYGWAGNDEIASLLQLQVENLENGEWKATFWVECFAQQSDGLKTCLEGDHLRKHDLIEITRTDPLH